MNEKIELEYQLYTLRNRSRSLLSSNKLRTQNYLHLNSCLPLVETITAETLMTLLETCLSVRPVWNQTHKSHQDKLF